MNNELKAVVKEISSACEGRWGVEFKAKLLKHTKGTVLQSSLGKFMLRVLYLKEDKPETKNYIEGLFNAWNNFQEAAIQECFKKQD